MFSLGFLVKMAVVVDYIVLTAVLLFGEEGDAVAFYCVFDMTRNAADCYCYISNAASLLIRQCERRYYECYLVCDDATCGRFVICLV